MKMALHWRILIGMAAGIAFGVLAAVLGWQSFVTNFIKPFGTIFINLLKLIAVPLVIGSLVKGVSDLKDLSRLSSLGWRTFALYISTTVLAITIGLLVVNIIQPGKSISAETKQTLLASSTNVEKAESIKSSAAQQQGKGWLQPLVDIVPENIFAATTSNANMLQVIFFAVFFGVGLMLVKPEIGQPVKASFDGVNEVILKLIDLIMLAAPLGVFALLAALIAETQDWGIFRALAWYGLSVLIGLSLMLLVVYPTLVRLFTGRGIAFFFRGIAPAQLLAFSTSSSAATLPVTMERVEEHLGVEREVTSFVLPLGATINMDGTSLYQAVAAVFIAQALSDTSSLPDLNQQLTIILTATLASIGTAAVPGAGMVMLVIVLGAIGVPEAGLALIFAIDRILDMCRTVVNVTGDATVSMVVAKSVGKLHEPRVHEWSEDYHPEGENRTA